MAGSGIEVAVVSIAADALVALAKAISTGPTPEEIRKALEKGIAKAQQSIDVLRLELSSKDEQIKQFQSKPDDFSSKGRISQLNISRQSDENKLKDAEKRLAEFENDLAEHNQQFPAQIGASSVVTDAVQRLDDASVTFEALVQEFGGSVTRIDDASRQLQGAVDELFGPRGEMPEGLPDGFQRASFRPPGRFLPAPRSATGGGSISGGLLPASDAEFEDFRDKAKDALGEIDAAALDTFGRIEGFMVRSLETGKFEWRGLASVAIDALNDILNQQLRAAGASSSLFGGGGGFGGILGSLFQIGASFLGPAGGGAAALSSSALSLSGPRFKFAHGGRPPSGVASLVGEDGPELFIPDSLGEIIPNDRLGGSGGSGDINVTYNVDARGAAPGMEQRIMRAIKESEDRAVLRAKSDILQSAHRGGAFARMGRV